MIHFQDDTIVRSGSRESVKLTQIFDKAEKKTQDLGGRQLLLTYFDDLDERKIYEGELMLVLGREMKRAVEVSSAIALRLGMKFPEKNVLMFNTYASEELLTMGFVKATFLLGIKVPNRFQVFFPEANPWDFDDTAGELPSPENVSVLDCPTSTLTAEALESAIVRHNANVVILNSLDYAAFSDYRKRELAEALLALRHKLRLTVIVFSHQLRPIVPYSGGRGALGLLSAFTDSVWLLLNEWEKKLWTNRFKSAY